MNARLMRTMMTRYKIVAMISGVQRLSDIAGLGVFVVCQGSRVFDLVYVRSLGDVFKRSENLHWRSRNRELNRN